MAGVVDDAEIDEADALAIGTTVRYVCRVSMCVMARACVSQRALPPPPPPTTTTTTATARLLPYD
jgi:hypothetical protein